MFPAVVAAWALLLGIGLMMLGNGLQGTLLGIRALIEGFSTPVTGLVMTGYYIGFLAGSVLAPKIVERVGHIRAFAALAAIASAAVLLHPVYIDPWFWGAMRVATGFSYAGLYVVAESWLNGRATNETRGKILSVYMIVMLSGLALGQLLLNFGDPGGFELFILVSVLVSLALLPISLTAAPAPDFHAPTPVGLLQLYRISPLGVIGGLGVGVSQGTVFGIGAVYASISGMSTAETSLFMALIVIGGIVLQWPIGWLSDIFDRRRVIAVVTFIAAGAAIAGALLPLPLWGLMGVALVFGGVNLPMYSLCGAHINDHLSPAQTVGASSGLVLVTGLGAVVGPAIASVAMDYTRPAAFFWWLAAIHMAIGVFAIWRMTRSAPVAGLT